MGMSSSWIAGCMSSSWSRLKEVLYGRNMLESKTPSSCNTPRHEIMRSTHCNLRFPCIRDGVSGKDAAGSARKRRCAAHVTFRGECSVVHTLTVALPRHFSCGKLHHHMLIRSSTLHTRRREVKIFKLKQLLVADDG
jgi:hypothetical protein